MTVLNYYEKQCENIFCDYFPLLQEFEVSSVSEGLMTKKILMKHEKPQTAHESQITMLKCTHHHCDGCPACTEDKMEAGGGWMLRNDLTEVAFTASN